MEATNMSKKKGSAHSTRQALLDALLSEVENPQDIQCIGELFKGLKKELLERILAGELTQHLGYEKNAKGQSQQGNARNGYSQKKVLLGQDQVALQTPRDREGSFTPTILPKGARRLEGFDDSVISLYARGLSVREIQAHLKELYQIDVSADLISSITDGVLEQVKEWQNRPLERLYALVFFDCLFIKTRHEGVVKNRAYYVALGYTMQGQKEVLGLWVEETEGAKFWLKVMTELKNRGVQDILIACVDGLKGFPQAIEAVFPQVQVQTCVVHQIRHCLKFVPWKDRKAVANDLKSIYKASSVQQAQEALEAFKSKWDSKYPAISASWISNWEKIIPFLDYPPAIRKLIYTTNAVESLNSVLRRSIKNRGHFPSDEAALKLLYLAIYKHAKKWGLPPAEWYQARACFYTFFEDRIKKALGDNWMMQ